MLASLFNRMLLPVLIFIVSFIAFHVFAYELENPSEVERISQVTMLEPIEDMSNLKVCVLDRSTSGFSTIKDRIGKNIKLVGEESQDESFHGLAMAQELLAASGALRLPEDRQPQIYLVAAEGYTEFKNATQFCIKEKVDIILHSINWDWTSNFDGSGFINDIATQAAKNGILWINSAGNNGGLTYHSHTQIAEGEDDLIALPDKQNTLRFSNKYDNNIVNITLTWNDFAGINYATKKDMDFILYSVVSDPSDENKKDFVEMEMQFNDGTKTVKQKFGQKKQIGRQKKESDPENVTGNALESAEIRLDKGEYALQVVYKSKPNTIQDGDQFRIILRGQKPESLKLHTDSRQLEITAPADNADVISVGIKEAPFSAVGPTSDGRAKPDLVLDLGPQSLSLEFSDGTKKGVDTSDAAALFAGVATALKARDSNIGINELKNYLSYLTAMQNSSAQNRGPVWQTPTNVLMLSNRPANTAENQAEYLPQNNAEFTFPNNGLYPYDQLNLPVPQNVPATDTNVYPYRGSQPIPYLYRGNAYAPYPYRGEAYRAGGYPKYPPYPRHGKVSFPEYGPRPNNDLPNNTPPRPNNDLPYTRSSRPNNDLPNNTPPRPNNDLPYTRSPRPNNDLPNNGNYPNSNATPSIPNGMTPNKDLRPNNNSGAQMNTNIRPPQNINSSSQVNANIRPPQYNNGVSPSFNNAAPTTSGMSPNNRIIPNNGTPPNANIGTRPFSNSSNGNSPGGSSYYPRKPGQISRP